MSMPVDISRRQFFRAGAAVAAATAFGFDLEAAAAAARELKIARTSETRSVCPYCAVGCGVVIHTLGDRAQNVKPKVVHIEGDVESPISRGTLCPKGISLKQYVVNDRRLTEPRYRAPGASEWTQISWDEAISRLARLVKDTRDRGFEEVDGQGRTVNRLRNVAIIGGCTDTNEINYLLSKLRFSLGVLAYENQARL
jgi:formate dehydrogenase major subunit